MSTNNFQPFVTLVAQQDPPAWLIDKANKNNSFFSCVLAIQEQDILAKVISTVFNLIIIDENIIVGKIIPAIRNPQSLNLHTPAIALTPHTENDHKKHLITLGFDDCLPKPLINECLDETIRFWQGHNVQFDYLWSLKTLLDNCRNNRKLAISLYEKLFDSLPQQIDSIETAFGNGDFRLAYDITHKLNGSVKTCFLKPVGETADCLKKIFNENKPELIEPHFLALKQRIGVLLQNREKIFEFLEKGN